MYSHVRITHRLFFHFNQVLKTQKNKKRIDYCVFFLFIRRHWINFFSFSAKMNEVEDLVNVSDWTYKILCGNIVQLQSHSTDVHKFESLKIKYENNWCDAQENRINKNIANWSKQTLHKNISIFRRQIMDDRMFERIKTRLENSWHDQQNYRFNSGFKRKEEIEKNSIVSKREEPKSLQDLEQELLAHIRGKPKQDYESFKQHLKGKSTYISFFTTDEIKKGSNDQEQNKIGNCSAATLSRHTKRLCSQIADYREFEKIKSQLEQNWRDREDYLFNIRLKVNKKIKIGENVEEKMMNEKMMEEKILSHKKDETLTTSISMVSDTHESCEEEKKDETLTTSISMVPDTHESCEEDKSLQDVNIEKKQLSQNTLELKKRKRAEEEKEKEKEKEEEEEVDDQEDVANWTYKTGEEKNSIVFRREEPKSLQDIELELLTHIRGKPKQDYKIFKQHLKGRSTYISFFTTDEIKKGSNDQEQNKIGNCSVKTLSRHTKRIRSQIEDYSEFEKIKNQLEQNWRDREDYLHNIRLKVNMKVMVVENETRDNKKPNVSKRDSKRCESKRESKREEEEEKSLQDLECEEEEKSLQDLQLELFAHMCSEHDLDPISMYEFEMIKEDFQAKIEEKQKKQKRRCQIQHAVQIDATDLSGLNDSGLNEIPIKREEEKSVDDLKRELLLHTISQCEQDPISMYQHEMIKEYLEEQIRARKVLEAERLEAERPDMIIKHKLEEEHSLKVLQAELCAHNYSIPEQDPISLYEHEIIKKDLEDRIEEKLRTLNTLVSFYEKSVPFCFQQHAIQNAISIRWTQYEKWKDVNVYAFRNKWMISTFGHLRCKITRKMIPMGQLNGYAVTYITASRYQFIHILVALTYIPNPCYLPYVDHSDRDRTNNRVLNLRWCDPSQNACNKGKTLNATTSSIYKGVCYNKSSRRWQAQINKLGVPYYLGRFRNEEEAAQAYNKAARKLHQEFAVLNPVNEKKTH
jgi:hypothetical protein